MTKTLLKNIVHNNISLLKISFDIFVEYFSNYILNRRRCTDKMLAEDCIKMHLKRHAIPTQTTRKCDAKIESASRNIPGMRKLLE